MKDMLDIEFEINDVVAKAETIGHAGHHIVFKTVTNIIEDKLYLDHSKQHMRYPERLLIMNRKKSNTTTSNIEL